MSIIEAKNVSRYFGVASNPIKAVDNVSVEIPKGSFTVLLGRSGSGKSTLLNQLCGLDQPTSGELIVNGQDLGKLNKRQLSQYRADIGIIFQSYNLLTDMTAVENVMIGAWAGGHKVTTDDAKKLMDDMGIGHRMDATVNTLSGGEKQRVAIARALISNPDILFCDEPTGALDTENEDQVTEILRKLNKEKGITIVMVTHNPNFRDIADQVVTMSDGKISKNEIKKAKSRAKAKTTAKGTSAIKNIKKSDKDDLTKVEGIGPKINEALNTGGIMTFVDLSKAKNESIQEMIKDVRGNHTSDTWPQQAKLAAEGKWEELDKLQDELDGGRVRN